MAQVIDLSEEPDDGPGTRFPCSNPVTSADVARALQTIFLNPDKRKRTAANKWVVAFKQSPVAWRLSRNLLEHPQSEVQQFGARIILDKVTSGWASLDAPTKHALPASLLTIISEGTKSGRFQRITLITISDALACCFVKGVLGYCFDEDSSGGHKSKVRFTTEHVSAMKRALFSLRTNALTGLLQTLSEMARLTVQLTPSWSQPYAARVRQEMKSLTRETVNTIKWVLSSESPAGVTGVLQDDALHCLQNWLNFGIPSEIMADMSDFFLGMFRFLSSPTTFGTAVDVLDVAMSLKIRHLETILTYVRRVAALKSMFHRARGENDDSVCTGIARLATRCGEKYITEMTTQEIPQPERDALCSLIVECSQHPTTDVASLAFKFWSMLAAALIHSKPAIAHQFAPYFQKVLQRTLQQASYPSDYPEGLNSWNPTTYYPSQEELDGRWVQFRECSVEALQSCFEFLSPLVYLKFLKAAWEKHAPPMDESGPSSRFNWRVLEGVLFATEAVVSKVPAERYPVLSGYLGQVLVPAFRIAFTHPLVAHAICKLLGALGKWIGANKAVIDQTLSFLFSAAVKEITCYSACEALKNIARECGAALAPKLGPIMQRVQKSVNPFLLSSSTQPNILNAKTHLFNFLVIVAKTAEPSLLKSLLSWISNEVQSQLTGHLQEDRDSEFDSDQVDISRVASAELSEEIVLSHLTILTNTYRHFISFSRHDDASQLIISSLKVVWRSLDRISARWPGNDDIMEAIAALYSVVWQSCKQNVLNITPMMLSKILPCFEKYKFPFCLNSLTKCVLSLGNDAAQPERWQGMTAKVTSVILSNLTRAISSPKTPGSSLSAKLQPFNELLVSYFPLLEAVTNYSWQSLARIPGPAIKSLFGLISSCILFEDQENTTKVAVSFLISVTKYKSNPAAGGLLRAHGSSLLRSLLIFSSRSTVSPPVQKIIVRFMEQMLTIDTGNVSEFLRKMKTESPPHPSNQAINSFLVMVDRT